MNRRLTQTLLSVGIFGAILFALVSIDPRVRDRFRDLLGGGDGLSPWGDRLGDLGSTLFSALRHQSIENAPMVFFAVVGGLLFVFMVRS
jgi:hypothetical protein